MTYPLDQPFSTPPVESVALRARKLREAKASAIEKRRKGRLVAEGAYDAYSQLLKSRGELSFEESGVTLEQFVDEILPSYRQRTGLTSDDLRESVAEPVVVEEAPKRREVLPTPGKLDSAARAAMPMAALEGEEMSPFVPTPEFTRPPDNELTLRDVVPNVSKLFPGKTTPIPRGDKQVIDALQESIESTIRSYEEIWPSVEMLTPEGEVNQLLKGFETVGAGERFDKARVTGKMETSMNLGMIGFKLEQMYGDSVINGWIDLEREEELNELYDRYAAVSQRFDPNQLDSTWERILTKSAATYAPQVQSHLGGALGALVMTMIPGPMDEFVAGTLTTVSNLAKAKAGRTAAGFMMGSTPSWYRQGVGSFYRGMRERGVPPDIARLSASVGAYPYALLEGLPEWAGMQLIQRAVGKKAMEAAADVVAYKMAIRGILGYAAATSGEIVEEDMQWIAEVVSTESAVALTNQLRNANLAHTPIPELWDRLKADHQEAVEAMLFQPMAIMGAGGGVLSGAGALAQKQAVAKAEEAKADEAAKEHFTPGQAPVVGASRFTTVARGAVPGAKELSEQQLINVQVVDAAEDAGKIDEVEASILRGVAIRTGEADFNLPVDMAIYDTALEIRREDLIKKREAEGMGREEAEAEVDKFVADEIKGGSSAEVFAAYGSTETVDFQGVMGVLYSIYKDGKVDTIIEEHGGAFYRSVIEQSPDQMAIVEAEHQAQGGELSTQKFWDKEFRGQFLAGYKPGQTKFGKLLEKAKQGLLDIYYKIRRKGDTRISPEFRKLIEQAGAGLEPVARTSEKRGQAVSTDANLRESERGPIATRLKGEQEFKEALREPGEDATFQLKTSGAKLVDLDPSVATNAFRISTPSGAAITAYYGDADIGDRPRLKTRGEVFFVEVPEGEQRGGVGLSLLTDALTAMKERGAQSVVMRVPGTAAGQGLVRSAEQTGALGEKLYELDTGTTEYSLQGEDASFQIEPKKAVEIKVTPQKSRAILKHVEEYGGVTYDVAAGKPLTTGYAVALGRRPLKATAMTAAALKKYANANPDAPVVGVWKDENDVYWIEPSEVIADRAQAIKLGKERNQISIFDLDKGEEIQTGGTGETASFQLSDIPRKKDGSYVGLPHINSPQQLGALVRKLRELSTNAEQGAEWYKESAEVLWRAFAGDIKAIDKVAGLVALFSRESSIKGNLDYAVRYYFNYLQHGEAAGQEGRRPIADTITAAKIMRGESIPTGLKRKAFYRDIMRHIVDHKIGEAATVDVHMARVAGLRTDSPSPQSIRAIQEVIAEVAKRDNIPVDFAQAKIWVAAKAQWDFHWARVSARAIRLGHLLPKEAAPRYKQGQHPTNVPERWKSKELWAKYRDMMTGLIHKKFAGDITEGLYNFGTHMTQAEQLQINLETVPGIEGILPEAGKDYHKALGLHYNIMNVLVDENGVDLVAQAVGLPIISQFTAPGTWMGESNPAQGKMAFAVRRKGKEKNEAKWKQETLESVEQRVKEYAAFMVELLYQDSVGYVKAVAGAGLMRSDIMKIAPPGKRFSPQTIIQLDELLRGAIEASGEEHDAYIASAADGSALAVRVKNDAEWEMGEKELGKRINAWRKIVLAALRSDDSLPDSNVQYFMARDSGLIGGQWGEDHKAILRNSDRSDSYRRLFISLAKEIDKIYRAHAEKHGWTNPPEIRTEATFQLREGGDLERKALSEDALKKNLEHNISVGMEVDKDGTVELRHYSNVPDLKKLIPEFHGTGRTGAEAKRWGPGYLNRSFFGLTNYVKERNLGPHMYKTRIPAGELYDLTADPLGLGKEVWSKPSEFDPYTDAERAVYQAGFTGVAIPKSGVVILFSEQPVKLSRETFQLQEMSEDGIPEITHFQPSWGRSSGTPVIKNPTRKEMKDLEKEQEDYFDTAVGILITPKYTYAFRRDNALHGEVAGFLGLKDYIGVLFSATHDYATITDATTEEYKEKPSTIKTVQKRLGIRDVSAYNEDIVGYWEELDEVSRETFQLEELPDRLERESERIEKLALNRSFDAPGAGRVKRLTTYAALQLQLKVLARGHRLGTLDAKESIKKIQDDIRKFFDEHAPEKMDEITRQDVKSLLTKIARARTAKTIEAAFVKIEAITEAVEKKQLVKKIDKVLKKYKPKVDKNQPKGTNLTPDVYRELADLKKIRALSEEKAIEIMAGLDEASDNGTLSEADEEYYYRVGMFGGLEAKSPEQLQEAYDHLKELIDVGRSRRQQIEHQKATRRRILRSRIVNEITGGEGVLTEMEARAEKLDKKREGAHPLRDFDTAQQGWEFLMDKLVRDSDTKPGEATLSGWAMRTVSNARQTNNQLDVETQALFTKKREELYGLKGHALRRKLRSEEKRVKVPFTKLDPETWSPAPIEVSPNELYQLWQVWQNEESHHTLYKKMGYPQETMEAIEGWLQKNHPALLEWARWQLEEFFPSNYQRINEVYKSLRYVDLPFRAIYSPWVRNVEGQELEDQLLENAKKVQNAVNNGHLKSRVKNENPFKIVDGDDLLLHHVQLMNHYVAWAPAMNELRSVLGSRSVKQAIRQYHGNYISRVIDTKLDDLARGGVDRALTNRWLAKVRNNFNRSVLGRPTVMIKQLMSVPAYWVEMPVARWAQYHTEFWGNPKKHAKMLIDSSPMLKARYKIGWDRDIITSLQRSTSAQMAGTMTFSDYAFFMTKVGDKTAILAGGYPVYRYHYEKLRKAGTAAPKAHELAIRKFEQATTRSQQAGDIEHMASLQTAGDWAKLMTMFMTAPNQYYRISSAAMRNMKAGRGSKVQNAKAILITWVVLPQLFLYASNAFPGLLSDWDDDKKMEHMIAAMLGPYVGLLIAGDAVESILGSAFGQRWDYSGSGIFDDVSKLAKTAFSWGSKARDDKSITMEEVWKITDNMLDVLTHWPGIPYGPVRDVGTGIYDVATGKDPNLLRVAGFSEKRLGGTGEKRTLERVLRSKKRIAETSAEDFREMVKDALREESITKKESGELMRRFLTLKGNN